MIGLGWKCMDGDVVEMVKVVAVGVIVPFDVGELLEIANIGIAESAVDEKAGHIGALRRVGSVELVCMVVEPGFELFLGWFFGKVWWFLPSIARTALGIGLLDILCGKFRIGTECDRWSFRAWRWRTTSSGGIRVRGGVTSAMCRCGFGVL